VSGFTAKTPFFGEIEEVGHTGSQSPQAVHNDLSIATAMTQSPSYLFGYTLLKRKVVGNVGGGLMGSMYH
jgi:hypothetical protein